MEEITEKSKKSFLVRLCTGQISLPITYWVFGFLIGNIVFGVINIVIELNYLTIANAQFGVQLLWLFYFINVSYVAIILTAVWRSAKNYQGNRLWSFLARLAVVIGAVSLCASLYVSLVQENSDEYLLEEEVRLINTSLPSMLDEDTRLDEVSIYNGDLHYEHTLPNWTIEDLDIPYFKSIMTTSIYSSTCNEQELREMLNEGTRLVYKYRDKNSKPITTITAQLSNCFSENEEATSIDKNDVEESQKLSPSEIFNQYNEAIVLVRVRDSDGNIVGFGSGFNVDSTGLIVTNFHVILSGGEYLEIKFPKHGIFEDVLIAGLSIDADVALLAIDGKDLPTVVLADTGEPVVGDRIYTISNPEGYVNSLSEGIVSAERYEDGIKFLQITAPISEGSSGGALMNQGGEVIGIVSLSDKLGQNLNFAVDIGEVFAIEQYEEYFSVKELWDFIESEEFVD